MDEKQRSCVNESRITVPPTLAVRMLICPPGGSNPLQCWKEETCFQSGEENIWLQSLNNPHRRERNMNEGGESTKASANLLATAFCSWLGSLFTTVHVSTHAKTYWKQPFKHSKLIWKTLIRHDCQPSLYLTLIFKISLQKLNPTWEEFKSLKLRANERCQSKLSQPIKRLH